MNGRWPGGSLSAGAKQPKAPLTRPTVTDSPGCRGGPRTAGQLRTKPAGTTAWPSSWTSGRKATTGHATTTMTQSVNTASESGSTPSGTNARRGDLDPAKAKLLDDAVPGMADREEPVAALPGGKRDIAPPAVGQCHGVSTASRLRSALQSPQLGEPGASAFESWTRAEAFLIHPPTTGLLPVGDQTGRDPGRDGVSGRAGARQAAGTTPRTPTVGRPGSGATRSGTGCEIR